MYTSNFPIPAVTADVCVLRYVCGRGFIFRWEILLIRRGENPHKGKRALPGGHGEPTESLEETGRRELKEETNPTRFGDPIDVNLKQFHTFSNPEREPRGWYVTTAFWTFVDKFVEFHHGDDADAVDWFPLNALPPLAFDHLEIIKTLVESPSFQNPLNSNEQVEVSLKQ